MQGFLGSAYCTIKFVSPLTVAEKIDFYSIQNLPRSLTFCKGTCGKRYLFAANLAENFSINTALVPVLNEKSSQIKGALIAGLYILSHKGLARRQNLFASKGLLDVRCTMVASLTVNLVRLLNHRYILLGPPGRARVFPYLSPGPLDLWWYAKNE